jgi:hypothetical protein
LVFFGTPPEEFGVVASSCGFYLPAAIAAGDTATTIRTVVHVTAPKRATLAGVRPVLTVPPIPRAAIRSGEFTALRSRETMTRRSWHDPRV